ncbi:MAG: hypothetical protein AMJ78_06935 [Omnitrophica WOR_2 bacterium SM23_29]|nr:MAG: hypothetical protein AMJ78_06935 [Omnitrophica WOR_2 bacterium SM23_29]
MVSLENKFIRNDDIAWRIIDGEALVVSPKSSLIYPLNEVATRIWELLDGKRTVFDISSIICDEFEGDTAVIQKDVVDFIQDLLKGGLINGM